MSVLTLITKWCCTDKIVYIKTIRMVFKKLFEDSRKTGQDFIEQVIGSRSSQVRCFHGNFFKWLRIIFFQIKIFKKIMCNFTKFLLQNKNEFRIIFIVYGL